MDNHKVLLKEWAQEVPWVIYFLKLKGISVAWQAYCNHT